MQDKMTNAEMAAFLAEKGISVRVVARQQTGQEAPQGNRPSSAQTIFSAIDKRQRKAEKRRRDAENAARRKEIAG